MTLLTVVLIVNAPVFAGLVGAHIAGRDRGFDAIAGLLLIGEVLLALAKFGGISVVGWIGFGISMFVWALFLLKYHRPLLRFFSGGRLAAEKRFSAVDVLESRYHLKLDGPLRSFLAGQLWRKHDGRLVASLPTYISEPHTNLRIRFGEIAVAEAAADWDVD